MKRFIKCSTGSCKATGRTWSELIRNIESTLGYEVDAAYRRSPDDFIALYKDGESYLGEVTKYYDGMYELLLSNIRLWIY